MSEKLLKVIEMRVDLTREHLIEDLVMDIVLGFVNPKEVLPEIARTNPRLAQRVRDIVYPKPLEQ